MKSWAKTTRHQQLPKKTEDQAKLQSRSLLPTEQKTNGLELQSWSDLPPELLEKVFSPLNLIENVRASAVCKQWHRVAVSSRVVNLPPWIMYFPKNGEVYKFYDPYTRKSYAVELKELSQYRVCSSKNGWLLVCGTGRSTAFFNPFTREMIKLPNLSMTYQIVAFSCAPTDPSCVVFAIKHISPNVVTISTCFPGAEAWSTANYENQMPFVSSIWNKLVFSGGLFFCLSLTGWLGVFNPKERTWNVLVVPPPMCPENFYTGHWWGRFLADHNGKLLVVYTCCTYNPVIFKLDRSTLEWESVQSLDDVTLFAGYLSTHSRTDLPGEMRNSIFFSKVRFFGKRCVSYSLRQQRYFPRKQCHDWGEQEQFESVWIDQPKDLSSFFQEHSIVP